jgi:hypothetical protein
VRDMPHEDFQQFAWKPTDPFWTDVVYVQQPRVPVYSLDRAEPRRSRNGPVLIKRHPNVCQRCNLQAVANGKCRECDTVQVY